MPAILSRRAAILFKIEASEGVSEVPTPGANAVLVEQPVRVTLGPNVIDTTEVNPSLDPFDPIVGGMSATIEFDVYMKGSSAVATAPEWGPLLKCCGYGETITAAAIPPAGPEALTAGGATTTQTTLGATAVGSLQLYRGMPISFTGANVLDSFIWFYGSAKLCRITDTALAALGATTNYQIPANVLYIPSTGSISSATIWFYNDGLVYKFAGARGTVVFNLTSGGACKASFRFMAMFVSKTDAALPTTATYDSTRPPVWKGGSFTINSAMAAGSSLSLDTGNSLVQPDNPNTTEAFEPALITLREMRGTMNPKEVLVATRDIMASFRTQTKQPLHARFGTVAGNRIGFTVPNALYLNTTPGDDNGYQITDVPFDMSGVDSGLAICSY